MSGICKILIVLGAFHLAMTLSFGADDSAIIDGRNYSFTIAAPAGWHLTSTRQLQAAFYPEGSTFDRSPVVMYVRSADKDELHIKAAEDLNRLDLRGTQEQYPKAESKKVGSVQLSDGSEIPIYSFSGAGYFELVGYAEQPKTITVFVLSSETEKDLKASEKAFRALVASYLFISENVTTPKP
jgi:hypothetical protein